MENRGNRYANPGGPGGARSNIYFRIALDQGLTFYPRAQVAGDERGLMLRNSPPPIAKKHFHFPVHNPQE